MATKHYYAMHTPYGDAVDTNNTPIGTVFMFSRKRARDEWVEDNEYNTYNGNAHQTMTLTEHEARVIMLRQHGREMSDHHRNHGLYCTYREYAQWCPTWLMYEDYEAVIGAEYMRSL